MRALRAVRLAAWLAVAVLIVAVAAMIYLRDREGEILVAGAIKGGAFTLVDQHGATVTEADGRREASVKVAEGEKQAAILRAEGAKQGAILQAEGARQAAILNAEGYALALEKIYGAARTVDSKTMSLQYLEALKALGPGPATKFVLPMEFTRLLEPFIGHAGKAAEE